MWMGIIIWMSHIRLYNAIRDFPLPRAKIFPITKIFPSDAKNFPTTKSKIFKDKISVISNAREYQRKKFSPRREEFPRQQPIYINTQKNPQALLGLTRKDFRRAKAKTSTLVKRFAEPTSPKFAIFGYSVRHLGKSAKSHEKIAPKIISLGI